ncbi:MAG: hypothetical protein GY832_46220 [Chloroflexi bacterium]|nr:hypothetical protein [Chloroflexota bacterium]
MTRKIEINWMELDTAFQSGSWEMRYYLDLETGDVVMVTDEIARYLEDPPDWELSDWMKQAIEDVRQVEAGSDTRYIQIPQADTHEDYCDMERFISTVRDSDLRDRLWRAIKGRSAFRYFKDVLTEWPLERERWFSFKDRCIYERVSSWLESENIEPTNPIGPPAESEPVVEIQEESISEALLEKLTLLVIYLSSWEEQLASDLAVRRAWKGYLFEVLDDLEEKGYINQTRRTKSLMLTEDGVRRARELEARYAL